MDTTGIRNVIDAMSRDSLVAQNAATVAAALRLLYPGPERRAAVRETIKSMLSDESWSQDREPYAWLAEVSDQF